MTAVILTSDLLDQAIINVDIALSAPSSNRMNAIDDAALLGSITTIWDNFTNTLHDTFLHGAAYTQDKIDSVIHHVDTLIQQAGAKAKAIHADFKNRLRLLIKNMIDGAFAYMPTSIDIGGITFKAEKLSFNQKLALGGSLKANFLEAAELTAHGEIEIHVEYTLS